MNLQQLEYILAVEEHRHFVRAAEACFVTQPTLSAMIHKLEEELGCMIFDRSKQPVRPTEEGERILVQARKVIYELNELRSIAQEQGKELQGTLSIAVIPTLAPYLLPLFLKHFTEQYPKLQLHIQELNTQEILLRLERDQLDAGILATPVHSSMIKEARLFYEPFYVYAGKNVNMPKKRFLAAADIDLNNLWLLEEGHCLRSQVMHLCELKKKNTLNSGLHYDSGSIESLIRMVDAYDGITILPELAVSALSSDQRERTFPFADPIPEREISLVTFRQGNKQRALEALKTSIHQHLPRAISRVPNGHVLPI